MEKKSTQNTKTLKMDLIDSHAHLNEMDHIVEVIQRARLAGVNRIVAVGMDMDSNVRTLQIAKEFPGVVFSAIGYHPWSIRPDEIDNTLAFINDNLKHCCALGEVGLDYKVKIKKAIQQEVFSKVLKMACIHNKPAIIHSRYSYERTHHLVRGSGIEKAVFHWYSGPLDVLDRIIKDGHYISATPALAYSAHHQAAIANAPLDRILIETDCPVPYKGKASQPGDLVNTLKALSSLKNEPMDVVGNVTAQNPMKFFGFEE
ncbi:MAG: TatD family hydrolase [Desulfobacterales bacterium]|nr:TatD family hydrolase [Desulfobacterales bacterium]